MNIVNPFPAEKNVFIPPTYTGVNSLTLWTPEDGIPTLRKKSHAAGLRYTVQTARYHTRRRTVYLRYCA